MSILVDKNTKVLVQGMGREGQFHAKACIDYGTKVVGGVAPGKGGTEIGGIKLYETVEEAKAATGANTSMIFVPPFAAADSIIEAAEAGIGLIICITEGIPTEDMLKAHRFLEDHPESRLIGPNCPGVITPGVAKVGIMPGSIHKPGHIGVISRSGTLMYEGVSQICEQGLGESTCVGIGGDPIIGSDYVSILKLYNEDPETEAILIIGEIGGSAEIDAADYAKANMKKPLVAFIAGRSAPPGRRMGHAGAIADATSSAPAKIAALKARGVTVVMDPAEMGKTVRELLEKR